VPGLAVQVTVRTASVSVRSPTSTGSGSVTSSTLTSQPACGFGETLANGASAGSVTRSWVVAAVSDSLGTRKTSFP
jgi:hypothetical protein